MKYRKEFEAFMCEQDPNYWCDRHFQVVGGDYTIRELAYGYPVFEAMHERALAAETERVDAAKCLPSAPSVYKTVSPSELPEGPSREHLLNEAANRAAYFFRRVEGDYHFPAPDGQVAQIIQMLLAAANMPLQDRDLIRFDYVNADGNPESKVITHDDMRERYADRTSELPGRLRAVVPEVVLIALEKAQSIVEHARKNDVPGALEAELLLVRAYDALTYDRVEANDESVPAAP